MPNKLILDSWQLEVLNYKGNKILCTGRQVGKTTICAKDAGDWAVKHPNSTILMIAPTERQAGILFEATLNYLLQNFKSSIKTPFHTNVTKTKINFKNGTRILCLPCGEKGTGIRGYTIHRLYIDEASRVPPDVFDAVTPSLITTAGDIILLSTPFGRKGFFWECWNSPNYKKFYANTEDVIRNREISETWTEADKMKMLEFLEDERKFKTKLRFQQEYVGLFVEDLLQFFPDELIKSVQTAIRPLSVSQGKYYLGVDVGGRGGSETTFEIVRKDAGNKLVQVENIHQNYEMTTFTEREILHLDNSYKFKRIYIDDGGLGCGVFDHLLEHPQTKQRIEAINNSKRNLNPNTADKVRLTTLMKNDLYDNLLCLMERKEIELLDDPELFQSLKSVQFEITDKKEILIYGEYTHIAEGLIRACWCIKDKSLNPCII